MTSITFSPAVPCSSVHGDRLCGKPSTVATLYPSGGGQYLMQPFCKACVAALLATYGGPIRDDRKR